MQEEEEIILEEEPSLREQFEAIIATDDKIAIRDFLNDQNISEVADLVYDYPDYETQIIGSLSINRAVALFKILDLAEQKRIINELPPFKTAELLNELPADDRTDFLEGLPSNVVRELIKLLTPEERKTTLNLLGYPENSVGRLMTPEYVWVYEHNTVAEVLETIRRFGKDSETIDVIYVINSEGNFLDDIRIRDIILSDPDRKVSDLMDGRTIVLYADDDQENASNIFKMNNRVALPVVSRSMKLLGIVTIDDILWVAEEEYSEDIQKIGGTEALDEPYLDTPILKLFRKRVVWLIVLFIGELLTASVMEHFEAELAKAVVLALFIPLIISSGGNSGSQASTLVIQALAIGEITLSDWWKIMKREIISGLLLGTVLGAIGYLRVIVWHGIFPEVYGPHYQLIGLVLGITLLGIVLWGTLCGSMLPLALKRLGADPAVSSAPFVATLVDITGLLIYFSVAFAILSGIMM
ncbi:MAG: magnesium transporter [Chitinophagaceae bacterium]|nr:magnesium transporter [Chitinophagaceae bacterium]